MTDPKILFTAVIKVSFLAGFCYVGDTKLSKTSKRFMNVHLVVTFSAMFYQAISASYLLFYLNEYGEDGSWLVCFIALCISSCSVISYYTRKGPIIQAHYKKMIAFSKSCFEDSKEEKVQIKLHLYSKRLNKFLKYTVIGWFLVLFFEDVLKIMSFLEVNITEKGPILYCEVPYTVNSHAVYWPSFILQGYAVFCMMFIQQTHRNYLFAVMLLMALCFQYLRYSLRDIIFSGQDYIKEKQSLSLQLLSPLCKNSGNVQENYYSWEKDETEEKVVLWVKRHTELHSLCKEFVDIYTPLLITYFMVMFVILISGVFSITQNEHYYGLAEEILLGLYFGGMIFNLFMLSIAGSNLTYESLRTFDDAFHSPWYNCSPRVKSSLNVICAVSHRQVQLAAFGSKHFNMSLQTFIWVMKTMVSFYIGLAQMKQLSKLEAANHQPEM